MVARHGATNTPEIQLRERSSPWPSRAAYLSREPARYEACLGALSSKLLPQWASPLNVARSTWPTPTRTRLAHNFADFAQVLIGIARPIYAGESRAWIWIK